MNASAVAFQRKGSVSIKVKEKDFNNPLAPDLLQIMSRGLCLLHLVLATTVALTLRSLRSAILQRMHLLFHD